MPELYLPSEEALETETVLEAETVSAIDPFHTFELACHNGNLELAKMYNSSRLIDYIHGIYIGCLGGHLDIVMWCYSKGQFYDYLCHVIPIIIDREHLEIIKWCISENPSLVKHTLAYSCMLGKPEIIKLCLSNNTITATDINIGLYYACKEDDVGVIEFLKSQIPELEKCCEDHIEMFS